jgi:hypothetical protein
MWEVPFGDLDLVQYTFAEDNIVTNDDKIQKKIDQYKESVKPIIESEPVSTYVFKTKPFKHQLDCFYYGLEHDRFLLADDQGLGKAQPLDSIVYTPEGRTTMGDIKLGDDILGRDGKTYKVLGVYPQGKKDIYKITFDDGSVVETCDEHLWTVKNTSRKKMENPWFTTDLKSIMKTISKKQRYWIPMTKPVHFKETSIPLHPYLIGVLLGDGGITKSAFLTTADKEIHDNVVSYLPKNHELKKVSKYSYCIVNGGSFNSNNVKIYTQDKSKLLFSGNINEGAKWLIDNKYSKSKYCKKYLHHSLLTLSPIRYGLYIENEEPKYRGNNKVVNYLKDLRLLGTNSHTKFIPDNYLYNSLGNRIALLQGLIDTDGYVSKTGILQYTSVSKQLIENVKELVQSLGGNARLSIKDNQYYTLTINLPEEIQPCRLNRKLKRYHKRKHYYKPRRIINKIEFVGKKEAQCIRTSAKDSLYLTDEFIVTHNTKQVIDLAVNRKHMINHCLIVCGVNTLKWNWLEEIQTHSNESAKVIGSYVNTKGRLVQGGMDKKLEYLDSDFDDFFIITNMESLRNKMFLQKMENLISTGEVNMVAIDEIHKMKSSTSKVGKAIHKLQSYYRVGLSGTPLITNALDLYNILKWLGEENGTLTNFKYNYCIFGGFGGREIVGYKNMEDLRQRVENIQLRRLKEDVFDLPPKLHQNVYVELEGKQRKLYKLIEAELIEKINDIVLSPNPLAKLTRLRQVTSAPGILDEDTGYGAKIDRLVEIVDEVTTQGHKVLVYSNWTQVLHQVKKALDHHNPLMYTGEQNESIRNQNKNTFQNDESRKVIVGTVGAMGTGITLNKGSYVIFLDVPWSPQDKKQAEDRAHRIGTNHTVNVLTFITRDTVDEYIEEIVYKKSELSNYLVDGKIENNAKLLVKSLLGL